MLRLVLLDTRSPMRCRATSCSINEQLRRAMEAGDPVGPEARKLVAMHGHWLRMY